MRVAAPCAPPPCSELSADPPSEHLTRASRRPPSALPFRAADMCAPCPAQFALLPLPPPLPHACRRPFLHPPLRAPPRPLSAAALATAAPCTPQQGPVRAATPPSALPLRTFDPCAPCPAQFASQPLPPPLPRARRRPAHCAPLPLPPLPRFPLVTKPPPRARRHSQVPCTGWGKPIYSPAVILYIYIYRGAGDALRAGVTCMAYSVRGGMLIDFLVVDDVYPRPPRMLGDVTSRAKIPRSRRRLPGMMFRHLHADYMQLHASYMLGHYTPFTC